MQSFNFALRQSTAESVDENRSRYVPSSIYSGPGPVEEYPIPPQPVYAQYDSNGTHSVNGTSSVNGHNGNRHTYQSTRSNSFAAQPVRQKGFQTSNTLKNRDPVVIHLLAETALSDSRDFEILSFEELEQLKRDRLVLRNRLDSVKRKIELECKLRDAAHSLNRLYIKNGTGREIDTSDGKGHNRTPAGSKTSNNDALSRASDEYQSSTQKIGELTNELQIIEVKLEDISRRILEHTAGILQLTHKGLKKNVRRNEIPRSPESMISPGHHEGSGADQSVEFDERSLYPVPDYVHEFIHSNPVTPMLSSNRNFTSDSQAFDNVAIQLQQLSLRLHDMIRQLNPIEDSIPPPDIAARSETGNRGLQVQDHLNYISGGLDALVLAQQRTVKESENVKAQIHKMLERTNPVGQSPLLMQDEQDGEGIASQLASSNRVLEQLHTRIDTLVEQKDILTRQIQQQRELNTKSDAQRDAQIRDLTEELEETKRLQAMYEKEAQESQNEISMLIEQLDRTKQDTLLLERQRGMDESKALQAEREARKAAEKSLLDDIAAKQQENVQVQADIAKMQNEFELRSQQHIQQLNDLLSAKEQATITITRHEAESEKHLEQMAALQTELTIVKAELDGAYGTRAQRAADVSLNPAIQQEIDSLNLRNSQLQKELKETIEDYEQMTKASIEFEKERDRLESAIDTLREKCELLELQLNEEKLKWLGIKAQAPNETTSTMVLKNEFKKMMRDTRTENSKVLKAEQDERRRLEGLIRSMRREAGLATPAKSTANSHLVAEPITPSKTR